MHQNKYAIYPKNDRLALERSATAKEAVETIGALVEANNDDDVAAVQQCFVIASEKEVWLLNVVGKLWAAEHVKSGFRRIGAGLSLTTTITETSVGMYEKAVDLALWRGEVRQLFYVLCDLKQ